MLDTDYLNLFLQRTNIASPSCILLKSPYESDFHVIESRDDNLPVGLLDIPTFEQDHLIEHTPDNQTLLWFRYPDQRYIVLIFPQATKLDDYAVNVLYRLLFPINLEKRTVEPGQRFENIISSIVELSATVDFDVLIDKILEKTISIVMADAGMLWVYDNSINKLVCKAYKGNATELALSLHLELGEGLIGKTFLRGTPKLYSSYDEVLPDIEDYSTENKQKVLNIFGDRQMDSAFLMPIFVKNQIECLMIVHRLKGNPPFSPADIETLKIFAELIEMTMTNARSLITLKDQLDNLEKCNLLYSRLTSLSVNNSGIANIVKELKKILNMPVFVLDLINQEQFPRSAAIEKEVVSGLLQLNIKNNGPFLIEAKNKTSNYRIYPIFVENACMGYLLTDARSNESQMDEMILEIGRMVIALELSKAQSMLDMVFKKAAQNFFELVNSTNPLDLTKKSFELGLSPDAEYAVAVLTVLSDQHEFQSSFIYRLIAQIKIELAGAQKLVFSSQEKIVVLISTQKASGRKLVHQQIAKLLAQVQNDENISLCAGLGSFYAGVKNINNSYREAENALIYQLSRHTSGLLKYADMGVNQLFINLTAEEARAFLSRVFTPLREHSRQGEYLENTLITYIESNGSMVQTAKKLFIHTNTLYQRLKKIEDCLQISLKNPDDHLQIQLACYLRKNYPDVYDSL